MCRILWTGNRPQPSRDPQVLNPDALIFHLPNRKHRDPLFFLRLIADLLSLIPHPLFLHPSPFAVPLSRLTGPMNWATLARL